MPLYKDEIKISSKGQTAKMWMEYHSKVTTIKNFIRAGRLHNFNLHNATVVDMLLTFAAVGHSQYAKGAATSKALCATYRYAIYQSCSNEWFLYRVYKIHTVRYSKFEWSGRWTDMTILDDRADFMSSIYDFGKVYVLKKMCKWQGSYCSNR